MTASVQVPLRYRIEELIIAAERDYSLYELLNIKYVDLKDPPIIIKKRKNRIGHLTKAEIVAEIIDQLESCARKTKVHKIDSVGNPMVFLLFPHWKMLADLAEELREKNEEPE
jgi:hypothetical protein